LGWCFSEVLQRNSDAPAGDQLDDQHDYRDQKNQVNEIPDGIDIDESKERENQQHNKDGPEHTFFPFGLVYFASFAGLRLRLRFLQIPFEFRRPPASQVGGE
jgi:hypothetical protein